MVSFYNQSQNFGVIQEYCKIPSQMRGMWSWFGDVESYRLIDKWIVQWQAAISMCVANLKDTKNWLDSREEGEKQLQTVIDFAKAQKSFEK